MTLFSRSRMLIGTGILALSMAAFAGVVEDAQKLVKDGKYDEAIALLEKGAKSPATTKALVDTHMAKGDYFMGPSTAAPRVKYTTALQEYRKVLTMDKTNQKAAANIKTIEDIYKSMGRPVPQ